MTTIGVFAAIFDEQGLILCVKRAYGPKNWTTPGGGLEAGETPSQGIIREVREETGYLVKPGRLVGVYSAAYKDDLVISIEAIIEGRDEWAPNCEITQCGFWGRDELPQPMRSGTRQRILDAFDRRTGMLREWTEDPSIIEDNEVKHE
jgi:8-oxo-dGTP diphosphatase